MQSLKVVIVGDPGAGKTRLATSFHTRGFPGTYVPNVFDNQYSTKYLKHGISYTLGFWDTNGHEDHNRLRPLAYPQTDVFLVCFDVTRRESYLNVKGKWLPELRHHLPEVSVLLVATKIDLRSQCSRNEIVTAGEAQELARTTGLQCCESSSLLHEGIDDILKCVVSAAQRNQQTLPESGLVGRVLRRFRLSPKQN